MAVGSTKNLKRGNPETEFKSGREAAEAGRKGGIASGVAKRKKGQARKLLFEVLQLKPQMTPALKNAIQKAGANPEDGDFTIEAIAQLQFGRKLMTADLKAYELYMRMVGEDPATIAEEKRLALEKEAIKTIQNSDGFMEAMNGIAEEVFTDGGDTPDAVEDE